jgi:MerR family transcriptional regulator, redox-sensitive transcriptional activator SoxR
MGSFMAGTVRLQVDLKSNSLTIGELARLTSRSASSIRYYEEIGLLPPPVRVSGQRRYAPEVGRTLTVIDTAQRAGLTLQEIKPLLGGATEALREVAERKLPELEDLIARAEVARGWLEAAARCECPSLDDCALFEPGASACA